jgi:D-serine deaminase-like pyridoxal phosphate-dependent protein
MGDMATDMAANMTTSTPALVVDIPTLDRNIAKMAGWAKDNAIALRPHVKTHKTVEIARRQVQAGATGITIATLGEAETFAEAGFRDLFVAYPLWAGADKASRLAALCERARLRVGVDSVEGAALLGRAVRRGKLEVLVEVDCGHHRSGVAPSEAAAVADAAAKAGLSVIGVFTFPGHSYAPGNAAQAARDEAEALERATSALELSGHAATVRSGGSTPSAYHSVGGLVTELRPGVYVFNDRQQVVLETCTADDVSLWALATVVSAPCDERFVVDSGSKVLAADRPDWLKGYGLLPELGGAGITQLTEHHAVVRGVSRGVLRLGDRVRVVPNHVCSAVNLADELVAIAGDGTLETWAVRARGKNS